MENTKLGIVILNYNTWRESVQCVDSVIRNTQSPYHIYLIDNCSTDDSIHLLQDSLKIRKNITLIKAESNRGYSAGNNIGIKRAIEEGCDMIFIINSDVELLNNALDRMKEALLSNDECMVVGPSIVNNEGKESQLARKKLTWSYFIFERHPLCYIPYFKKKSERGYEIPKEGDFIFSGMVLGCCFGLRSEDMERLHYLDENVFLYYEEDILAYKMERLCKKALINSGAKIWHKEGTSTKKEGNAFIRFCSWSSALYLLKNYAKISRWKQYFIVISNVLFWIIKAGVSDEYSKLLKKFINRNVSILRK